MDKNIIYLPPCEVIAAGTNRNIMQAGMRRSTTAADEIQQLRREVQDLNRQKTEALAKLGADYINLQIAVVETNVKQAGIASTKSDREMLDTMISFMIGDSTGGYQPPSIGMLSDNPQQSNLKQGGIHKKKASDIEMLNDFLAFSGLE